ncbi:ABC transporter ATP-binding protein [Tsukamurella soli]|uniref:Multidrug efflux ABC transporter ATP-binding protein n=1 Tax=Tsukamurella soli TaxID=644556 RepID=A0ABP8JNI0_9ACTN
MANNVIEARGLRKHFGHVAALDGVDLDVAAGDVHALIGPNGAGMSTAIRVFLGLLRRSGGSVSVLGGDPWRDGPRIHRRIGYVPGDVTLWPSLTGGETIDLIGRLRGRVDDVRRTELIERFELDPHRKCRTYSKGNRQKVALISALVTPVDLLIFDEPTSGLDPLMEEQFAKCIAEARNDGTAVLLSSHNLSEVEHLADTVTVVKNGVTVDNGSLADMRRHARTRIDAVVTQPLRLDAIPGVRDFFMTADRMTFTVDIPSLPAALAAVATAEPTSVTCRPPTLEEMFLARYDTRESVRP